MNKHKKIAHPEIALGIRLGKSIKYYNDCVKNWAGQGKAQYFKGKRDAYQNCLDSLRELYDTKSSKSFTEG